MYKTHTHTYIVNGRAHTRTHSLSLSLSKEEPRTRTPTRSHRYWQLRMWVTGPLLSLERAETVPKPALQSDRFRTPKKKTSHTVHKQLSCFSTKAFVCAVKKNLYLHELPSSQSSCFAYLSVTSRRWGPGGLRGLRAGEKNRRPTSYYDVQSCAIETVGRTILQVQ